MPSPEMHKHVRESSNVGVERGADDGSDAQSMIYKCMVYIVHLLLSRRRGRFGRGGKKKRKRSKKGKEGLEGREKRYDRRCQKNQRKRKNFR